MTKSELYAELAKKEGGPEIIKILDSIDEEFRDGFIKLGFYYDANSNCLVEFKTGVRIKSRSYLSMDELLASKPEYLYPIALRD
jgi:hypothetical protein